MVVDKETKKEKKVHIFCLINIVGIYCKQPITDRQARNYKIIIFLPLAHLCKSRRIFFFNIYLACLEIVIQIVALISALKFICIALVSG